MTAQPVSHSRKIDIATPQLTKNAVPHRVEIAPPAFARPRCDMWLTILEVYMANAIAETIQPFKYHGRIVSPRAIQIVPGVEHQADQIWVGAFQKARDLSGRLDIAGAVMVKHSRQASLIAHGAS